MAEPLRAALITLGDPRTLTGGYLYHRRMAALAPRFDTRLEFVSFPLRPFPLAAFDAGAVLRQARRRGAEVLVLDSIAAAFLGPRFLARAPDLPVVGMLHQPPGGIDSRGARQQAQARLDRLAYARVPRLMVASAALSDELVALGYARARLTVVLPGRDVAAQIGTPPGDLRQGRKTALLCVANWSPRKGIHSLLAALARLPAETATLHLAGDENVEPRYAAFIRRQLARPELAGRVVRHGPLPVARVAALYAAADVFVLPSVKEPFGTVLGEAMAAGLPVVGWNAGNLPHLAQNEREGLILPPGNVAALSAALLRLAADEPLRRTLGDAARLRASTRPTWEDSAALFFRTIRAAATGEK